MSTLRLTLCCALVGWMAADAQAQLGTYGSPDPIPLGAYYAPQYYSMPAVAARPVTLAAADSSGPTLAAPPAGNVPQPPAPYGSVPQPPTFYGGGTQLPAPAGSAPQPLPLPPPSVTSPSSESAAVSSLLNQPSAAVGPSCGCNMLPPGGYMKGVVGNDVRGDACGSGCGCGGGGCGGGGCGCGCGCGWYAAVDALAMTRNAPRPVYTSAEANSLVDQGSFNTVGWDWGVQATLGYRFGCGCDWAVEGTYWSLAEACTDGGPGIPGPYVTPMTMSLTDLLGTTGGNGPNGEQTANQFTDNSPCHHVWLNWTAQNLEFNLVRNVWGGAAGCATCGGPCGGSCGSPCGNSCGSQCSGLFNGLGNCQCNSLCLDFMLGVRWFRFQDGFVFGAERANDGSAYANDWFYLNDHITNDLIGVQTGLCASYRFADCWKVFITPKFGLYDNHMTLDYNAYAQACSGGQQYQASSSTYCNPNYPVHTTADGFSCLTQVDLGLDWQVSPHFGLQLGYRLMAMTGMGLSGSQIPFYGNDTQAIANISHTDSLILHGAFGGITFCW